MIVYIIIILINYFNTLDEYEEYLITDEDDPSGKKKIIRIQKNKTDKLLSLISKYSSDPDQIDYELLKSILNLNPLTSHDYFKLVNIK